MGGKPARDEVVDPTAYCFQSALIEAIEAHVSALRRTRFHALRYRGADFGRVIAIELYFRLINDADLRKAFDRQTAGEILPDHPDAIPISTVANWVFQHMSGRYRNPLTTLDGWKSYIRERLTEWRVGNRKQHRQRNRRVRCEKESPVVALALSRRFYSYLLPIVQQSSSDPIWLVPDNQPWVDELAAQGKRVERFTAAPEIESQAPILGPLMNWEANLRRYDHFLDLLCRLSAATVVVAEGNNPDDEILARAAQSAGVRSICIQQGWSPVIHNGFRRMRFDMFCVWGEEFARMLRPLNRRQPFAATGSHMIAPLEGKADPAARGISVFLQKDSLLITQSAWIRMLEFVRWCATTWPDREILVREHPAGPLTAAEMAIIGKLGNVVFCPAGEMPLQEVLDRSELAIAFFSTTLIEALGRHVVPLIVNITGAHRYCPDLEAMGVAVEVCDFDQAKVATKKLLDGDISRMRQRIPAIINRFFAAQREAALDNIVRQIKKPA
ncbi:hypothetical protein HF259_07295 [Rhizobium leguminosarum]|uniref:hypothetical protein n=1 Tax=Rhizobium leguminosarum TaxID=384 RepID=UPI001C8FE7DF|nr:hypothetical protein [Rhizobium leguminosarum]MBY2921245.1 hypothetical protein [Rhizobium leguminosarum]